MDLTEGQEIELIIVSEHERAYVALSDLLVHYDPETENEIDETRLMAELDNSLQGNPSVSEAIIRERREGP